MAWLGARTCPRCGLPIRRARTPEGQIVHLVPGSHPEGVWQDVGPDEVRRLTGDALRRARDHRERLHIDHDRQCAARRAAFTPCPPAVRERIAAALKKGH